MRVRRRVPEHPRPGGHLTPPPATVATRATSYDTASSRDLTPAFDATTIHTAQQYAPAEAIFKSTTGRRERKVPLGATLAAELRAHRLLSGRREGLVFGADGTRSMVRAGCKPALTQRGRPPESNGSRRTRVATSTPR